MTLVRCGCVVLLSLISAMPAAGQGPVVRGPAISGTVIDAVDGRPLAHAVVELVPTNATTAIPRRTETGADGVYVVRGLDRTSYRLTIRKLGYRPGDVTVTIVDARDAQLSIGLEVAPILLERTRVVSERPRTFATPTGIDSLAHVVRVEEARARRQQFLGADVRELTAADVLEAVTLGEPDLFRSLQRLPGVTAAEDYSAEVWTRGARWDLTRIGFDGLPLFGPLHGFGLVSVLPVDAVGAATFFPGLSPLGIPEGAAGTFDLQSRVGASGAGTTGSAELSLLGARATLTGAADDGSSAWMLSGRRSYLDLASRAAERFVDGDVDVPYYFADLIARVDRVVSRAHRIESSVLMTRDRVVDDIPDLLQGHRVDYGNIVAQASLISVAGRYRLLHRVGVSRFSSAADTTTADSTLQTQYNTSETPRGYGQLSLVQLTGEVAPTSDPTPSWRAGYALERERVTAIGELNAVRGDALDHSWIRSGASTMRVGGWVEGRRSVGPWAIRAGSRVTLWNGTLLGDPRVELGFTPVAGMRASAGVVRRHTFAQPMESWSRLTRSTFWVAAGDSAPALKADVGSLGIEWWRENWSLALAAYARSTSGLLMADPEPGPIPLRAPYAVGRERARGLEMSVRRLGRRGSLTANYSWGNARSYAKGLAFPSTSDRRHSADISTSAQLSRKLTASLAATWTSGAPYTRTAPGTVVRDPVTGVESWEIQPIAGVPNASRAPAYSSVDLSVDRRFVRGRTSWNVYVQLRNALNHRNREPFGGRVDCSLDATVACEGLTTGLPRLPALGVRAVF